MPTITSALPVRADQTTIGPTPKPYDLRFEGDDVLFTRGDRTYRVRGLEKNLSSMQMMVNVTATRLDLVHLDTIDLVKAKLRSAFIKATASELFVDEDVVKKDIGQLLLHLEERQRVLIESATRPVAAVPEMSVSEREAALTLLRDPQLMERIVTDLTTCGIVGERTNKLVGYLAAVSRKLPKPLAVMIQSSSSAGKTSLMDAILALVPPEEQLRFSGMTGQSLFYLQRDRLKHKILAISEDQGITEAAYALKLLQSEGELRHACVGKNAAGRTETQQYHVEGPVQLLLTTTRCDIDPELMNRCLVLTVDESSEQTEAIQNQQRVARTRVGRQADSRAKHLRLLHHNAQRLLRRLEVYNEYAPQLTFATRQTRLRRDHAKYLALIDAVALLHQYQREVFTDELQGDTIEYIQVTPHDIEIANRLAAEVLGRSLDELAPQTRRFLLLLHAYVAERCGTQGIDRTELRFTRRDIREALGWTEFQVRDHLHVLLQMEYVVAHHGQRGRQFVYELVYDGQGQSGEPFLAGLIDPAQLTPLTSCDEQVRAAKVAVGAKKNRVRATKSEVRAS